MVRVGAYEAKTHLSSLLDRVSEGEWITITRHGVPVAVLRPATARDQRPLADVIVELRSFRCGKRLDGIPLREMIEEGRR